MYWCSGIQGIYAQLLGGVNLPWLYVHCALYIVLYMKLIWCNGFTDIYASLEVGGVNLPWVYCIVLYMNLLGVMVFMTPMIDWRTGSDNNLP